MVFARYEEPVLDCEILKEEGQVGRALNDVLRVWTRILVRSICRRPRRGRDSVVSPLHRVPDSRYVPTVCSKGLSIASIDRFAFRDCGTENDVGRVPFDAIVLMNLLLGLCNDLRM